MAALMLASAALFAALPNNISAGLDSRTAMEFLDLDAVGLAPSPTDRSPVTESFTQESSTRVRRQVYRPYRKNSRMAISIRTRNAITFSPFQSRSQAGEIRFRGRGWGTGIAASERNSRISSVLRRSSVERRRDALTSHAIIETVEPTIHVKYMAWSERNSLFQWRSRTITGNESAPNRDIGSTGNRNGRKASGCCAAATAKYLPRTSNFVDRPKSRPSKLRNSRSPQPK